MASEREQLRNELLVLRCRRDDRQAWRELIDSWEQHLFYYIRRLLADEREAWDVLQQTWLAAYEGIDRLVDPRQLAPWLYRIARNKAFDECRRRDPRAESLDRAGDELPISAEDPLAAIDDVESIHRAMDQVSLAHREVLTLYFLQDLSVEQVAAVLDVPAGTVKSRLHYAKNELRSLLDQEERS